MLKKVWQYQTNQYLCKTKHTKRNKRDEKRNTYPKNY